MGCTLKSELERHGAVVGISRTKDENDPLAEEIRECLAFAPDVAVECHNNAGGGEGFEVYRQTGKFAESSIKLAMLIEKQVVEMGQRSRGVKIKQNADGSDYFGWLRQLKCTSVLCEGAFVDNKTDAAKIDTVAEQEAFGVAYARGVLEYFGIQWKPAKDEQEAAEILYGVVKQVIALGDEDAAKRYAEAMRGREPSAYWFVMEKTK
jgi:N-acetylmuramoyl-L-alanine amidase